MYVDVISWGDCLGGLTDHLAVLHHRLAGRNGPYRQLMAAGDGTRQSYSLIVDRRTRGEILEGDDHVVLGSEAEDDSGRGHGDEDTPARQVSGTLIH